MLSSVELSVIGAVAAALFAAAVVIPGALDVFNSLVRDKLVKREDGRWKPTFGGWLLGNELYGRIYELAP